MYCAIDIVSCWVRAGLEAGQELLRHFWLEDRIGCSHTTERWSKLFRLQPSSLQCLWSQDVPHSFHCLAFSPQLCPPPLNFIFHFISLVAQLFSKNTGSTAPGRKPFGVEYILREAHEGEKRKPENWYFLTQHKIASHTYIQALVFWRFRGHWSYVDNP